jgi:hypothetical protein
MGKLGWSWIEEVEVKLDYSSRIWILKVKLSRGRVCGLERWTI